MNSADFFWNQVSKALDNQDTNFEWLYDAAKISKGTFSSWKTNNRLPRIDKAYSIAKCLGVSTDWLISGKDFESPQEVQSVALSSEQSQQQVFSSAANFCGAKTKNGEDYIKGMEKLIENRSFHTSVARLSFIKQIIDLDDKMFMNVAVRVRTLLDPCFSGKDENNDMPPPISV